MPDFNKKYYDDIWPDQGIHRHDYCDNLSNILITKYGKVRYLDIGTGCGFLVKILRDKGCEAYGLETSQHAVDNSHGNVILGSVSDIPFKENYFDVVFSQGLWEYIPEEDIQKAWFECNRVGKIQNHLIDTTQDTASWHKDFVTYKSQEWWNEKLKLPKILVACPNHQIKEYSFQRWIDNVKSLTYPNYDIFVSDNSPNDDFMNRYKDQIPIERIDVTGMEDLSVKRINYSYEQIRQKFIKGNYWRLMIIESDVIPPIDVIESMLRLGKDTDWISHAYPERGGTEEVQQGIGCSLFSRKLMETFNFKDFADNISSDGGLWNKVRPDKRFRTMELWNFMETKHLKE